MSHFLFPHRKIWRFETVYEKEALTSPFAWTDLLLQEVSKSDQFIWHIWPMEDTVILGMLDRKLADLPSALAVLNGAGYQPVIRNIGGLAVVADSGILNFSLIFPDKGKEKMGIAAAYDIMLGLLQRAFADFPQEIVAGEVAKSYCPGTYDLSIKGKKFAGMAQRRLKNGIAISVYLSVSGSQIKRGQLIRTFYQAGLAHLTLPNQYPDVDPSCMATLSDLLGVELSMADVISRLETVFKKEGCLLSDFNPSPSLLSQFEEQNKRLIARQTILKQAKMTYE